MMVIDMDKVMELQKMIDESNNIVFFGGAGVSTESGIKDFRSKDGLYNMQYKYPPEKILSHSFFMHNTLEFYKFYRDKLNCLDALPNICHKYLANLEKKGKLSAIVTQNIDGLHEKAGNKKIYNLHGSIYNNYCMNCEKKFDASFIFNSTGIPKCQCGGIIKPDVVLYEEALDDNVVEGAINAVEAQIGYYCHPFYQEADKLPCYLGDLCDNPHCIFKSNPDYRKAPPSVMDMSEEEGGDDDG